MTFTEHDLAEIEGRSPGGIPDRQWTAPTSGQFMYWRKADGWIVTGPAWPQEYARMVQKGMKPLDRYGRFADEPRVWDIRRQPYRQLLQQGGASEFTVAQVLELGWHRQPPMAGVTFPQLASVNHKDVMCEFCRRPYLSEEDLHRHQSISHRERAQNQQLARIIQGASTQADNQIAQALGLLAQAVSTLGQRLDGIEQRLPTEAEETVEIPPLGARVRKGG